MQISENAEGRLARELVKEDATGKRVGADKHIEKSRVEAGI